MGIILDDTQMRRYRRIQEQRAHRPPPNLALNQLSEQPKVTLIGRELQGNIRDCCLALGILITRGTVFQPPPATNVLLESMANPVSEHHSAGARALAKHSGRDPFWPEVQGSPKKLTEIAIEIAKSMLEQHSWWNIFPHHKHGLVYEVRMSSGHGMRWTADGTIFIGFVEPIDPISKTKFFNRDQEGF